MDFWPSNFPNILPKVLKSIFTLQSVYATIMETDLCLDCLKIIAAINEAPITNAVLHFAHFECQLYKVVRKVSLSSLRLAALAGCGICSKMVELPDLKGPSGQIAIDECSVLVCMGLKDFTVAFSLSYEGVGSRVAGSVA